MSDGWKYAGASVIGTSHLGKPDGVCQDAHVCTYLEDFDTLVCVVSDGAGSASHSDRGARLACETVVRAISQSNRARIHEHEFALETLATIRGQLQAASEEAGLSIRDFACTLLVAIAHPGLLTSWQIGDGAICFRAKAESDFQYVFWPVKGEYANVTTFVTDPTADSELEFDNAEVEIGDVALFSDGLERLILDFALGEVHSAFLQGLIPYLRREPPGRLTGIEKHMEEFLASERINKRTDDDKTLILATLETVDGL